MANYINESGFELGINGLRIVDDSGTVKYKLPINDGTNGQIIKTDGSGQLSFITPQSLVGSKGEKGDNGVKGDQGTAASKGDKGDKGDKGEKGADGIGTNGAQGAQGAQGPQGAKGERVSSASYSDSTNVITFTNSDSSVFTVSGVKGQKGDTGSKGDKGDSGSKGDTGPQGSQGAFSTNSDGQINSLGVGTAASTVTGQIRATNSITAFYSDVRLKENIQEIENALDKIEQLRGVFYNQNVLAEKFGYNDYKRQVGVIAQDVQKILPEAVTGAPFDIDKDGNSISGENYLTVYYEKIIPLLIQCIKELKQLIDNR